MRTIAVLFLLVACFVATSSANTGSAISGKITDSETGEGLPGVNILLVGTVLGTTSDVNGEFRMGGLPTSRVDLRITMMGYKQVVKKDIELKAGETVRLSIAMQSTVLESPEILITANKRRQNIQDSPNSIGVLTARDLAAKNQVYLDDLLGYASGVNFVGSQINIRGSSGYNYGAGSRVLYLIDGVPVMPGDSGDIKWDLVPASQVEQIEIIKGAGSALYGSNAMGGVVNIITKKATARPATQIRYSAGFYDKPAYEEWRWTDRLLHFDNLDLDHTRMIGSSLNLFASFGRHQSTGYFQNGHYQRWNAAAKLFWRLTATANLTLSTQYEQGDRGAALLWRSQRYALQVPPQAIGDYVESDKFNATAIYKQALNRKLGIKTRVSYFRNFWENFFHDNQSHSTAHRFGFEFQADHQISENNVLTFGSEESWDHVISQLVGTHDQTVLSVYAQNERRLVDELHLTVGVRFDHHTVDIGFADGEWSPKFGLVWHTAPQLSLRLSTGRGFRAASMSERFSEGIYSGLRLVPNPELKSETAWSHEFGANLRLAPHLFADMAVFANDYWDLIEPEPDTDQTIQFINLTRARIAGAEVTLKWNGWKNRLGADLGYTFLYPRDLDRQTWLAYRSRRLLTASASLTLAAIETGIDYRYAAKLDREAVKLYPNDDRVDQQVVDLRLTLNLAAHQITAQVKNLFNHNHTQVERTLLPIRHFMLTVGTRF
ncbi:TonB-dependent receptor [candidate division KSB1 bacterium]|nr:TonB-dependent receptor [candidate division KSB1 bacterium]